MTPLPPPDDAMPVHVVVMGVAGAGKSTVGKRLASALAAEFLEGDDHHSPASVTKMAAGVPLTDADREPWLDRLAAAIRAADARGRPTVLACSALRRSYRERLVAAVPPGRMRFIALDVDEPTLRRRTRDRQGHFMPSSLIESQVDTFEPLAPDEPGVTVDARGPIDAVVATALAALEGG